MSHWQTSSTNYMLPCSGSRLDTPYLVLHTPLIYSKTPGSIALCRRTFFPKGICRRSVSVLLLCDYTQKSFRVHPISVILLSMVTGNTHAFTGKLNTAGNECHQNSTANKSLLWKKKKALLAERRIRLKLIGSTQVSRLVKSYYICIFSIHGVYQDSST